MMVKTDVIIPFHGKSDLLLRCLKALAKAPAYDGKIYLVDDGSPQDEVEFIKQAINTLALTVHWTSLPFKSGFVAAVNYTWNICDGEHTIILNNDTIPPPGLIQKISSVLEQIPGIAAVAPLSDNPVDLFQYSPICHNSAYLNASYKRFKIRQVPYLTGMCLAVRRSAICKDYLFDPVFSPGYFEDLDLCCRLRTEGWYLSVLEDCCIHHTGRSTFEMEPDLDEIISRNYKTFANRWSYLPEHDELDLLLRTN